MGLCSWLIWILFYHNCRTWKTCSGQYCTEQQTTACCTSCPSANTNFHTPYPNYQTTASSLTDNRVSVKPSSDNFSLLYSPCFLAGHSTKSGFLTGYGLGIRREGMLIGIWDDRDCRVALIYYVAGRRFCRRWSFIGIGVWRGGYWDGVMYGFEICWGGVIVLGWNNKKTFYCFYSWLAFILYLIDLNYAFSNYIGSIRMRQYTLFTSGKIIHEGCFF